jgi:hypothetical protein
MRKFGVLAAFTLTWITASCAERMMNPAAIIPQSTPPKGASKPRPHIVEARRQAETIAESTGKRSAMRARQANPSASVKPEPSPEPQAPLPQVSQPQKETTIWRDPPAALALPPPPEPAEPNFPVAALMPPPPEPAEPTFPLSPPAIELSSPQEPPTSTLPEVPQEAAMPPPPEPAEPSFPAATLMSPPPEPAEPSLPLHAQEQIAAQSPILIPVPDLPSYLSLRPRFDWVDTVGAIELPHNPLSEALEASPEERTPSLIRNPWPLSIDGT